MSEDWITTKEAAELSGYHPHHLRRLIRANQIRAEKFGIVWRVNRLSLIDYLDAAKKSQDSRRGPKSPN